MDDLAQVLFLLRDLLRDLLIGPNKLFNQGGVVMCVQTRFGQAGDPVESVPGKQPASVTALCSRPNIRVSIIAALQFEMSPNRAANRHPLRPLCLFYRRTTDTQGGQRLDAGRPSARLRSWDLLGGL